MLNVCWSKLFRLFHNPLKKGGRGKDITRIECSKDICFTAERIDAEINL